MPEPEGEIFSVFVCSGWACPPVPSSPILAVCVGVRFHGWKGVKSTWSCIASNLCQCPSFSGLSILTFKRKKCARLIELLVHSTFLGGCYVPDPR